MRNSDDDQDFKTLPQNTPSEDSLWGPFGFGFGLTKKPTQTEFIKIAKYIGAILAGCVLYQWSEFHGLLTPELSKLAKYFGLGLVVLAGVLLYKMLEKHGLLKEKYESSDDNTNYDGDSFD